MLNPRFEFGARLPYYHVISMYLLLLILNLNFYLFFPTTGNSWCGGLVLFGSWRKFFVHRHVFPPDRRPYLPVPLCLLGSSCCQHLLDLPVTHLRDVSASRSTPKRCQRLGATSIIFLAICKIEKFSSCARQAVDPRK